MSAPIRTNLSRTLANFEKWLSENPVDGDRSFGSFGVRYQVARYCDYLHANPWTKGDPLSDPSARDGAVSAYIAYLKMFNTPDAMIPLILVSIDRFYVYLGLGVARSAGPRP